MTYKTIQIKALVTPQGTPTCRNQTESCKFYELTAWGSSERCFWTKQEITRADSTRGNNLGYTTVTEGCPVWANPEINKE